MIMRNCWTTLRALGVITLVTLGGCGSAQHESASGMTSFSAHAEKEDTANLFAVPQDQRERLQVAAVRRAPLTRTLRLTGAVAYNGFSTTPIISPVGGPVSRILVQPGEHVRRGQPLLEVASPDFSQLRGSYLKARNVFHVADKNYARAQDLYAHHAIAERDLLQAESDRIQAQLDLESSESGLRILGIPKPESLEKNMASGEIPLSSPIAGEIVERLVAPGQLLQAGGTQAFTISDLSTVWVLANVYQNDLAYVKVGDEVIIQTDSYPDVFHGKISFIAPSLDPNTRTLQARIVVENRGEKLKKDMYVTVMVTAGTISSALSVPDSAILRDDQNQPFVYVAAADNKFARRAVEIGESKDGRTQILKGLSEGENVVGDGSLFLQFANSIQH
jgi:membrane fusion protein, heavy metal efflux system